MLGVKAPSGTIEEQEQRGQVVPLLPLLLLSYSPSKSSSGEMP